MTSSHPSLARIEQIFFEVAALAPADREEAVVRHCAGDAMLESEVRAMLMAGAKIGGFLEQPALGADVTNLTREAQAAAGQDELVGQRVGPFVIRERLASGGMGTVYLAERSDQQFSQRVAIKVVKRGLDSDEIVRRFQAERQVLASLDHPCIARLIDGGLTADGRPYLAMEYVEGLPIDRHCDHHSLKIAERVALFRQVCDAVHHAHQNLVIHRDIKPSNILVTPAGVPKLLDFGIAKVLTGSTTDTHDVAMALASQTIDTQRRFTPEYASPEQVLAQSITTASDVYSLGVVLYELLTGAKPYYFTLRSQDELQRVICDIEPPAPSHAVASLPPRVRGTTAPAAKARLERSASATDANVEQSPSHSEAMDHARTRGISASRLRALLRGDLDTIVLMALRKEPTRRYASAEQFSADLARYLSAMPVHAQRDTVAYRARKFLGRHRFSVSAAALAVVLLAGATIGLSMQARALSRQRDALLASNRSLDEARNYLVSILGSSETGNHGPDAKLGDVLRDAVATLEAQPPEDALTRAASEAALGRAVLSLGQYDKAAVLLQQADAQYAKLDGTEDARFDVRLALAELLFFTGKPADAQTAFEGLLAEHRARQLSEGTPTQERARAAGVREGLLLNDLGAALRAQKKPEEALAMQREALAVREKYEGAQSLAAGESHNNIATALYQAGRFDEAIAHFRTALVIREAKLRAGHPLIIRVQSNLGLALQRAGKLHEALPLLEAAARAWPDAFGPDHPGRVSAVTALAKTLRESGQSGQAVTKLRELREWQATRDKADSPSLAATDANIALAYKELGELAQARSLLEACVPVLLATSQGYDAIKVAAVQALAELLEATGETGKANDLRAKLPNKR